VSPDPLRLPFPEPPLGMAASSLWARVMQTKGATPAVGPSSRNHSRSRSTAIFAIPRRQFIRAPGALPSLLE
jgi:hypothetical protein